MRSNIYWAVFLVQIVDSCVSIFCGIIRAIGKQGMFAILNGLCYYVIIIPASYLYAFRVGEHKTPTSNNPLSFFDREYVMGLGVPGIWLGILTGISILLLFQIGIVNVFTNWDEIANEAANRIKLENENSKSLSNSQSEEEECKNLLNIGE